MSKEVAHVFRYAARFAKAKAKPEPAAINRFNNFTLNHAWEKFDCQTQLLQREALLPLVHMNPRIMDADLKNLDAIKK